MRGRETETDATNSAIQNLHTSLPLSEEDGAVAQQPLRLGTDADTVLGGMVGGGGEQLSCVEGSKGSSSAAAAVSSPPPPPPPPWLMLVVCRGVISLAGRLLSGGAVGGECVRHDVGSILREVLLLPDAASRTVVPGLLPEVCLLVEQNLDTLRADSWASAGVLAGEANMLAGGGGKPADASLIEVVLAFWDKSVCLSLLPLPHIPAHADLDERQRKEKLRAAQTQTALYTHKRVVDVLSSLLLLSPHSLQLQHYKAGLRLLATLANGSADLEICRRALDHLYAMQLVISKKAVSGR